MAEAWRDHLLAQGQASAAQRAAWIKAFEEGRYQTLAATLRKHVFEHAPEADAVALYLLGQLHATGRGVPIDRPLACSFFKLMVANEYGQPFNAPSRSAFNHTCRALTEDETTAMASAMTYYYREGPPSTVIHLDVGHWVEIDRTDFRVEHQGKQTTQALEPKFANSVTFPVVHTQIPPWHLAQSGHRVRHLLEFFIVSAGPAHRGEPAKTQRGWLLYEVVGDVVEFRHWQPLGTTLGATYPDRSVYEQMRRQVTIRVNESGEVEVLVSPPK